MKKMFICLCCVFVFFSLKTIKGNDIDTCLVKEYSFLFYSASLIAVDEIEIYIVDNPNEAYLNAVSFSEKDVEIFNNVNYYVYIFNFNSSENLRIFNVLNDNNKDTYISLKGLYANKFALDYFFAFYLVTNFSYNYIIDSVYFDYDFDMFIPCNVLDTKKVAYTYNEKIISSTSFLERETFFEKKKQLSTSVTPISEMSISFSSIPKEKNNFDYNSQKNLKLSLYIDLIILHNLDESELNLIDTDPIMVYKITGLKYFTTNTLSNDDYLQKLLDLLPFLKTKDTVQWYEIHFNLIWIILDMLEFLGFFTLFAFFDAYLLWPITGLIGYKGVVSIFLLPVICLFILFKFLKS